MVIYANTWREMSTEDILKSLDIGIRVLKKEIETEDIDSFKEEAELKLSISQLIKELAEILENINEKKLEEVVKL